MSQSLSDKDVATLRARGLLSSDEVALIEGDMYVAENVVTKARRVIKTEGVLLEHNRKLLNG